MNTVVMLGAECKWREGVARESVGCESCWGALDRIAKEKKKEREREREYSVCQRSRHTVHIESGLVR